MNNQADKYDDEKILRFLIRKCSLRIFSILLGCFLVFGVNDIFADELTPAKITIESNQTEVVTATTDTAVDNNSKTDETFNETPDTSVTAIQNPSPEPSGENELMKNDSSTIEPSVQNNISNNNLNNNSSAVEVKENKVDEPSLKTKENLDESSKTTESVPPKSEYKVRATAASTNSQIIGDDYPSAWKYRANEFDTWGYNKSTCTSFVAHRLHNINKFEVPRGLGNAGEWGYNARAKGYTVNNTPARGSVAWVVDNTYGHVAWVASVSGNTIIVEEYNWNYDYSYHTRTMSISSYAGFIHFKDLSGAVSPTNPSKPSTGEAYHLRVLITSQVVRE